MSGDICEFDSHRFTTYKGGYVLTAVSLFAGVGGFDLALERNGVKVVAAVEIFLI
jgi:tRNA G37 N-methylase Trm5